MASPNKIPCPYCGKQIVATSKRCLACNRDLPMTYVYGQQPQQNYVQPQNQQYMQQPQQFVRQPNYAPNNMQQTALMQSPTARLQGFGL